MSNLTQLTVNGSVRKIDADPRASLLFVLRDQLDLIGTKYGCGEGQCGACTVLIDGAARRSCITPVIAAAGKRITTIEGLADGDRLHPLQQAFLDEGAMQCAYCTSGMIMTAVSLLNTNASPSTAQISELMEGNICRCGVHHRIIAAIHKAAKKLQVAHP